MSDWKEKVLENLRRSRAEQDKSARYRWGRHRNPVQLSSSLEYLAMIDDAAARLGYNRAAFIRRSAAVVAAKVVGVPVSDFLQETPYAYPRGQSPVSGGKRTGAPYDTGEGIEQFCPHPGCTGEHLLQ